MPALIKNIVIFDFDGTIVSRNTGSEFYKWMARKSFFRVILLTAMLPILIPLRIFAFFTNNALSQKMGLNIVCFFSTAFLKIPLFQLRKSFIDYYFTKGKATHYVDAVKRIEQHQKAGDQVIIISGCPEWILHGVTKRIGIKNVRLIGSKVSFSWKGIILTKHCHQSNKIKMAKERDVDFSRCTYGYSDSISDLPILKLCSKISFVNTSFPDKLYIHLFFRVPTTFEKWQ